MSKYSKTPLTNQPFSLNFLRESNYGIYYRPFLKHLGSAATILLSELVDKFHHHQNDLVNDKKYGPGWFYHTIEFIQERTGLTRGEQDTALKILKEKNLVTIASFGLPCKRHFRIHPQEIYNLYLADFTKTAAETANCFAETANLTPKNYRLEEAKLQTASLYNIKEPKEEPKEKESTGSASASPSLFPDSVHLVKDKLIEAIKKTKPDFKFPPSLGPWLKDIELMLRIDKRSEEDVLSILAWLPSSSFWRTNILSPLKLRKQFDKLQLTMQAEKEKAIGDQEASWVKKNTDTVFQLKRENPEILKHIQIQGKFVINTRKGKDLSLNQNPERFLELFLHIAEVKNA